MPRVISGYNWNATRDSQPCPNKSNSSWNGRSSCECMNLHSDNVVQFKEPLISCQKSTIVSHSHVYGVNQILSIKLRPVQASLKRWSIPKYSVDPQPRLNVVIALQLWSHLLCPLSSWLAAHFLVSHQLAVISYIFGKFRPLCLSRFRQHTILQFSTRSRIKSASFGRSEWKTNSTWQKSSSRAED